MGRMLRGSMAIALGIVVVLAGPAGAQVAFPPYPGGDVFVTPTAVTSGDTEIKVEGGGMPGEDGCRLGQVRLVRTGQTTLEGSILFASGNFDPELKASQVAKQLPLSVGEYSIFISCDDAKGKAAVYSTSAAFTVTNNATTTTTLPPATSSSTVPPAGGTQATVEPSTVKPGIDTITIRGTGFKPDAELTITLNTTPVTAVGTAKALSSGEYAATLKLPASSPPGTRQLVVTGPGPGDASRSTSVTLTVQKLTCADFASPQAAQVALGAGGRDPHGLDPEGDGLACGTVAARSATGSSGTPSAASNATGTLPATGTQHVPTGLLAGLAAMTLGALLVGLSHPAAPARRNHRRSRRRSF